MGASSHVFQISFAVALLTTLLHTTPGLASVCVVCLFTIILSFTPDGILLLPSLLLVRKFVLERLHAYRLVPAIRKAFGEGKCCHLPNAPTQLTADVKSKSEIYLDWRARYHPVEDYLHHEEYVVEMLSKTHTWNVVAVSTDTRIKLSGLDAGEKFSVQVSARNALGQSAPSNVVKGRTFQKPNEIDGGSTPTYTWGQGKEDVVLRISIPEETKSRDVQVDVHPSRLSIFVEGKKIAAGKLYDAVRPDDCIWDIETNENNRTLNLHMAKLHACENWPCIVDGDPRIDTNDIVYTSKWLGNYKGDLGVRSY